MGLPNDIFGICIMFFTGYIRFTNPAIENKKSKILPIFGKLSSVNDICHSSPAYPLLKYYTFQFLLRTVDGYLKCI